MDLPPPVLPTYGLDIETDTTIDGLDPAIAPVVAVAVATADHDHVLLGEEATVLRSLDELLATLPPGLVITWNGARFDLPFLRVRSQIVDVPLGLRLDTGRIERPHRNDARPDHEPQPTYRASWHHHRHLDGYRLYRADVGRWFGLSCGLKPLARLVGLEPVEVDRSRLHELDEASLRRYVASDAALARQLVLRRFPLAAGAADPFVEATSASPASPALPGSSAPPAIAASTRRVPLVADR